MEKAKNYLIAGGNSGMGLLLIEKLLNDGHKIIQVSRSDSQFRHRPEVEPYHFDALDPDFSGLALPDTLNGLVYFPGTINLKPFKRLKAEEFEKDWKINFMGAV